MKHTLKLSLLLLLGTLLFSCEENNNGEENNTEQLQTGEIRIKAYPNSSQTVSFQTISQKIIVDWGDGTKDELISDGIKIESSTHEYSNQDLKEIIIHTTDLKAFGASDNFPGQGAFNEIRFGDCSLLQVISISSRELTAFEIGKSDSLYVIDCSNNKLSEKELNILFEALPTVKKGYMVCENNAGYQSCDINIAKQKGWNEVESIIIDEEGVVVIVQESIFDDENNIKPFVSTTLTSFSDFMQIHYLAEALYSNTIEYSQGNNSYREIANHNIYPSNTLLTDMWNKAYRSIARLNSIIDKLTELNSEKYSGYIQTVSVLRAYTYFILINCWGDVPFVDENNYENFEELFQQGRTAENEILAKLTEDLLEAERKLPSTEESDVISFSKYFAQFILAKIYTYQGNYTKALEYTNKIIDSKKYSLAANSADIFNSTINNELITKFITTYAGENNATWIDLIKKGTYQPLGRYAEVYLLAAENNLKSDNSQNAIDYLNIVRNRNNRALLNLSDIGNAETAILEEYKEDLGKEGVYFFTLKRLNKAESVLGIESYKKHLPIPINVISQNPNITQNEGYQ